MRKIIAALSAGLLTLPLMASAQSAADLQAQAQALLLQVQQLQAQLAAQGATPVVTSTNGAIVNASTGATVPVAGNPGVNSTACPNIGRVLKFGTKGDDVARLQAFLARDLSIYPEAQVTGYFGNLTQAAVQRWQVKYNIVSSGTPESTGYGVVGPRTAAAIALLCSTGIGGGGATGTVGGYIQVSPVAGNAPLTVNVVATINTTNSCSGAVYTLNWGDNTNLVQIPVAANSCGQLSQTYTHVYSYGGTYTITLSAGAHKTSANVTVYGGQAGGGLPQQTFIASPNSGPAPLAVTFSGVLTTNGANWCAGCTYTLLFGDNTSAQVALPGGQGTYLNYSVSHTYQNAGTYTAILYQGAANVNSPLVGTATINASGSSSATYGPLQITPGVGGNPLAVNLSFDLPACGSYSVNWGDSTPTVSTAATCSGGVGSPTTPSLSHTYASSGSYTITVTRNTRTDTAGITISN